MNGKTGILGSNPSLFANGFEWDNIKEFVMKQNEPFDHIDIDLDLEDQKIIEKCIKEQENLDTLGKKAD